uniref:DUF1217 domain-containing protein n=1 Tax=Rhodopseudomonas palustris (strain BisA53) TaxID=316055 RepID=Q07SI4_RHOP5
MVSTVTSYQFITQNLARSLAQTASKPDVSHETTYYLAHIHNVTSVEQFVGDFRLFSYAMKAYGLADMTYAKAFLRKVLTEGVADPSSFANKLVDTRYREFAAAFNFASLGEQATRTTAATSGTVERYVRQSLEQDAGETDQGVQLALYFERKAPTLKTAYQILADKALLQVAQTTLGISPLTSMASIDRQAAMLAKKIDFSDFQHPTKLRAFLQRFSARWETEYGQTTTPSILINQTITTAVSASTLASLQNLKLGS